MIWHSICSFLPDCSFWINLWSTMSSHTLVIFPQLQPDGIFSLSQIQSTHMAEMHTAVRSLFCGGCFSAWELHVIPGSRPMFWVCLCVGWHCADPDLLTGWLDFWIYLSPLLTLWTCQVITGLLAEAGDCHRTCFILLLWVLWDQKPYHRVYWPCLPCSHP